MSRIYEIWGLDTANLAWCGDSQAAAFGYVREMIAAHGKDAVAQWALGWEDEDNEDDGGQIAWGDDLIALAEGAEVTE